MVSVFLWEQGKFKRFLQLIKDRNKNGYNSYFEAALEMQIDKIIPQWQIYLKQVEVDRNKIYLLPKSTVFQDEAAFNKFTGSCSMPVMSKHQL